jgi:DNA polymerase
MKLFIDFETRSTIDITKVGIWAYAGYPSTDILCMAWAWEDDPVQLWLPGMGLPIFISEDTEVWAHNAMFERAMWEKVAVPRYGFPQFPPDRWRCSAAKAAAAALPRSLARAAEALGLPVQKDQEGRRIMLKVSKPHLYRGQAHFHVGEEDMAKLHAYCMKDVEVEREITNRVRDLTPLEAKVWALDQKINARGICVDRPAVASALRLIESYTTQLLQEVEDITFGELKKVSERTKVMNYIKTLGVEMVGYTKAEVTKTLGLKIPENVRRILEIRQQLGKTSTAKYQALLAATCDDGRLRDTLMYHGAATGRWTGKLVQLHNLPRGIIKNMEAAVALIRHEDWRALDSIYGDVMGVLASCIRGMLIAAPGHELFVADYAAIEARVLFWLAGEVDGTRMFKNKEDIYVEMAKTIYRKNQIDRGSMERQLGKQAVLGCGYGMGAKKFKQTCEGYGIAITEDLAVTAVQAYRSKFYSVPRLWNAIEQAALSAVRNPGKTYRVGRLLWGVHTDGVLYCKLPSGRALAYHKPDVQASRFEGKSELTYMSLYQGQWVREGTFGGKLTENVTQAVARDLMAEAMLRLEEHGYPVVLSVHDEVVSEVPENTKDLARFCELMAVLPLWAEGCPVEAEGFKCKRYRK